MRYCCLEIRTTCGSCGQPVPVNGPFKQVTCSSCFEKVRIPADIFAGFLNDFEEEFEGLAEREGSGGTLMSGSGTYKYGHWRLTPRCSSCKTPLSLPGEQGRITCQCGETYELYHAPEWLAEKVPSVKWCVSGQAPDQENSAEPDAVSLSGESLKPVVMSCPQCSGALSISSENERIMNCQYCESQVYIPDAIWKRLHPVKKVAEWFACFQGLNTKQINAQRRMKDKKDEEEALKSWKAKSFTAKAKPRKSLIPYYLYAGFLLVAVMIASAVISSGDKSISFFSALGMVFPFGIAAAAVSFPIFMVVKTLFSTKVGHGKECKNAMAQLAEKHSWEHSGSEYKNNIGSISESYRGRDIEIHPDDDYAVEVDIDESIFYLKTEPPGYPSEDLFRFSTEDPTFDDLFPIRYVNPEFAKRMESSPEEMRKILSPVTWFVSKWGKRIGRMKIDWSSAAVHITPGCYDLMDTGGKYVPASDLEPLLEDMMVMCQGLDAVESGKEVELPEIEASQENLTGKSAELEEVEEI